MSFKKHKGNVNNENENTDEYNKNVITDEMNDNSFSINNNNIVENIINKKKWKASSTIITICIILGTLIIGAISSVLITSLIISKNNIKPVLDSFNENRTVELDIESIELPDTSIFIDTTTKFEFESTVQDIDIPNGITPPSIMYSNPTTFTVVNTGGHGLLMRTGPGTSYSKIQQNGKSINLSDGTQIKSYGTDFNGSYWYFVYYNGQYGWCCSFSNNTFYLQ